MSLALKYRMKKMAKGGKVDYSDEANKTRKERNERGRVNSATGPADKGVNLPYQTKGGRGESMVGANLRSPYHLEAAAKQMHKRTLGELKSMPGPTSGKSGFAEGGEVCMHCGGMGYSEGGEVANIDLPEADFMPNEFDVLHLEDNLESLNTGENSGDYDGDDVVKRAMAKRKK